MSKKLINVIFNLTIACIYTAGLIEHFMFCVLPGQDEDFLTSAISKFKYLTIWNYVI